MCRMLSCFHIYHKNCIDDWLKMKNTCPICNKVFDSQSAIEMHYDEEEMEKISVDNETFYSDHLKNRKTHLLKGRYARRIFKYCQPGDANWTRDDLLKVKHVCRSEVEDAPDDSDSEKWTLNSNEPAYKVKLRPRSLSLDND